MAIPTGIGAIIAIIVLIVSIVLFMVGGLDVKIALLIGALAVARLT